MSRRTRILLWVSLGLAAWFAVTIYWATQPLTDSVPVGLDKDGKAAVLEVQCNNLFDATAVDASAVPEVVTPVGVEHPWEMTREPCTLVHDQAQVLFGINVVVFLLSVGGTTFVATRTRQPAIPQMNAATA
jgi:hypothetical protein